MSAAPQGVALVTGASSGIGRAIAAALAERGMRLCLTSRRGELLRELAETLGRPGSRPDVHPADLFTDAGVRGLVDHVRASLGRLDVLVHCAASMHLGDLDAVGWEELDAEMRVNVRAPLLLTKELLPLLQASHGQVVFVSSTAAAAPGAVNPVYAVSKQALSALAAAFRGHVNRHGIRVLTVLPGRTATPLQERVHSFEGVPYTPDDLLQPSDVAAVVAEAVALPPRAEVIEIALRPTKNPQPTGGGAGRS